MVLDFQYDELLLLDEAIVNQKAGEVVYGYSIKIRYPSYRGTFLSCIEALEVEIDGKSIPVEDLRFVLNGKQFLVSELGELSKEHWFVLDTAEVVVMQFGGLTEGTHQVCVKLKHRIPYTGYFGQYLVLDSVNQKNLICG